MFGEGLAGQFPRQGGACSHGSDEHGGKFKRKIGGTAKMTPRRAGCD